MSARGHVRKRGTRWSFVVELPKDPGSLERRQQWHSGFEDEDEAQQALTAALKSLDDAAYVPPSRVTVAGFLEEWLETIEHTIRPSTHYSYSRNMRLHVLPYIGDRRLQKVDAGTLNGLYKRLLDDGNRARDGGLSPRSVYYVHTILHRAFRDAMKWDRLIRNPAESADPPKAGKSTRAPMVTWSADTVARYLEASKAEDDRYYPAWLLLATTGLRRGEALGLRWADTDLDAAAVSIHQTVIAVNHKTTFGKPKTDSGARLVDLDAGTVAGLRDHRRRQVEERLMLGKGWQDHDLVFCKVDGEPLHPERFSREFARRVERYDLPKLTLHGLRHTWATLALRAGIHPKVVQERLGHANISVTLDTYSHVTSGMQREAAEQVARLFVR